jgi:hypothetical protein
MTERILIEGSVDPPLLGQVHALANGIKRVGEESEKLAGAAAQGTRQLGEETAKAAQSTDRLGVSLRGVGEAARHLNEIREAAVAFGEAALGAVRGVAELAGEQQRLNANSARLRLDFAQAARGAGGFATEMQTMQLATNLANRNIRVTQSELDTLARVGMARARDAGQEVDEVFETIADSIIEGGEELGKFGQELLSVADESHNANDRLGALVSRAREVPETMRTASDEVARFESQLRQAGRYVSTGFVEEMARLQTVSSQTRGLRTDAEEARREMEALGRAGAYVLTQVGNVAGILVGAIAMSVRGIAGAFEGLGEAIRTRSLSGLRTGTAGAADDLRGIQQFIEARMASMTAMRADAGPRTSAAAGAAEAAPVDLVVTAQGEGIDPITGRPIVAANTNAGSTAARTQRPSLNDLMGRAFERSGPRVELGPGPGEMDAEQLAATDAKARESMQITTSPLDALRLRAREGRRDARTASEASLADARDPAVQAEQALQRALDTQVERERATSEERLRVQESFTDQWERLHRRQASATTASVDMANSAINKFGESFGKHVNLIISGQESVGEGVLNMVQEVVTGIGQEAIVKAAMSTAEGVAALAGVLTAPLAPGHFAAAGAYAAVGVAALGAGAILGAARGSGGGGAAAGTPATAPALPPPTQQDAEAAGGRNLTIVYGGGILGSPRELARHVRDVLEEGEQAGVRLPSRVVERAA